MIGISILVVLGIIALIRYLRRPALEANKIAADKSALDVLNERYAKGKISDEEHRAKNRK